MSEMTNASQNTPAADMQELISSVSSLVSLPSVYYTVLEMVENEHSTAAQLGDAISQDTNLTARLLRVANSAFYGFQSRIDTVSRAITIIGLRELRDIVLATSAIEAFNKIPINLANMYTFWNHSLYTGICARVLAGRRRVLHRERLFVAGLLHDIGHLVLFIKHPEQMRACMVMAAEQDRDIDAVERDIFGFDHAQLGAALMASWKLPQSLIQAVRYHHQPSLATEFALETSIIHVANNLAKHHDLGEVITETAYDYDPAALQLTEFSPEQADEVCDEADLQFGEARDIFLPKVQSGK